MNYNLKPFGRYLSIQKVEPKAQKEESTLFFKEESSEEPYGEYIVLEVGHECKEVYSNKVILVQNGMVEKYKDFLFVLENYVIGYIHEQ